jgi:hypothetical protein
MLSSPTAMSIYINTIEEILSPRAPGTKRTGQSHGKCPPQKMELDRTGSLLQYSEVALSPYDGSSERLNSRFRKTTKGKSIFPTEKMLFKAPCRRWPRFRSSGRREHRTGRKSWTNGPPSPGAGCRRSTIGPSAKVICTEDAPRPFSRGEIQHATAPYRANLFAPFHACDGDRLTAVHVRTTHFQRSIPGRSFL